MKKFARVFERKGKKQKYLSTMDRVTYPPTCSLFLFYRTCTQNVQTMSDITELDVSKRCKDLASFMESLLQETKALGVSKDGLLTADERSFSVTISYVLVSPKTLSSNTSIISIIYIVDI